MATFSINYRKRRRPVIHPLFTRTSGATVGAQIEESNLAVSPTGAAVVIRPKKTAIRILNTKGTGTVIIV